MMDRRSAALVQAACADLIDRLGAAAIQTGDAARRAIGGGDGDDPVAVVRPRDAGEVTQILRVARARHVPVQVRSRLPSQRPAALRGCIVLLASGLDRPPAIDTSRRLVTVGAAVSLRQIDRAARRARLALRTMPAFAAAECVAAWLGAGAGGELGLGPGELGVDLVSATIVTGSGRVVALGPSELLGGPPWALAGAPDPGALLVGAEGRLGVLIDLTLRLWPAPWIAWLEASLPAERDALLTALSLGRTLASRRLCDTILLEESRAGLRMMARVATVRGEEDLPATIALVEAAARHHGLEWASAATESPRARIGLEESDEPWAPATPATALDLRVAWPDAPKVVDVLDALGADEPPVERRWSLGQDGVRLRLLLPSLQPERHGLMRGARHLLDAGAIPTRADGALRELLRERIPSNGRVLLTALARAFDPDDVLQSSQGVL